MIHDNLEVDSTVVSVNDVVIDKITESDLVLFGSSTWGYGDLQEDFDAFIDNFSPELLAGKDVAVFGCGDKDSFEDVFCNATEIIKDKAIECGANIVTEPLKINGLPEESLEDILDFISKLPVS